MLLVCLAHVSRAGSFWVTSSVQTTAGARYGFTPLAAVNGTGLDGCRGPERSSWTTVESLSVRPGAGADNCTLSAALASLQLTPSNANSNAARFGLHVVVLASLNGSMWTRLGTATLPAHREERRVEVEWATGADPEAEVGSFLRVILIDRVSINDEIPLDATCAGGGTGTQTVVVFGTPILRRYDSYTARVAWEGCPSYGSVGAGNTTDSDGEAPLWWSDLDGMRISLALSVVAMVCIGAFLYARVQARLARGGPGGLRNSEVVVE